MNDDTFKEMAIAVVKKVDEKMSSPLYRANQDVQIENDLNKIRSLMEETGEDFYSEWFKGELRRVNLMKDVLRIHIMSAIIAYLAFIHQQVPPDVFGTLLPFEIFYRIYSESLKIKNLEPLQSLD